MIASSKWRLQGRCCIFMGENPFFLLLYNSGVILYTLCFFVQIQKTTSVSNCELSDEIPVYWNFCWTFVFPYGMIFS